MVLITLDPDVTANQSGGFSGCDGLIDREGLGCEAGDGQLGRTVNQLIRCPDLGIGRNHDLAAVKLTDLASESLLRHAVLDVVLPFAVRLQAEFHFRADDTDELSICDRFGVVVAEGQHRPANDRTVEVVVAGVGAVESGQQLTGSNRTIAIDDCRAAVDDITGDDIDGVASLIAKQFASLDNVVVDGGGLEHIGDRNIVAVLGNSRRDLGDGQLLAGRGHAFGDGRGGVGQRAVLAESDDLAAALGDRTLLAKLVMDQVRFGVDQKIPIIEGLHFGRHTAVAGYVGVQVMQSHNQGDDHDVFQSFRHFLALLR